jgi:hypothetical protein
MEKYPAKTEKKDVLKENGKGIDLMNSVPFFSPFLSFRYSSKSIFSDGEKTHIKATENRFENGRFESEEFEATMPQSVYGQMIQHMQHCFSAQMDFFLKQFSFFLPGPIKDRDK